MSTAVSDDIQLFQRLILEGIPANLPAAKPIDGSVSHAPKRKDILSPSEKKLALQNALRYFPADQHATLAPEFNDELNELGFRIGRSTACACNTSLP